MKKLTEMFPQILKQASSKTLMDLYEGVTAIEMDFMGNTTGQKNFIVIASEPDMKQILNAFGQPQVEHVVQAERADLYRDIITSCMMIKRPEQFLENPVPFFINNFEGKANYKDDARTVSYKIKTTSEKDQLIIEINKFLSGHPKTRNMQSTVLLIVDELITNAFFHAPVDAQGNHINEHLPRNSTIKLTKSVRLFVAHDAHRLIVGCEDEYGSIHRNVLLQKLKAAYSGMANDEKTNAVSAGLGCKMIIDRSLGFYVVAKRNVKTLVFSALELGRGEIVADLLSKNIHLCFMKD